MRQTLFIFLTMGFLFSCKPKEPSFVFIVKGETSIDTIKAQDFDYCVKKRQKLVKQESLVVSGPNGMTMEIPLREDERVFKYYDKDSDNELTFILKSGVIAINYKKKSNKYNKMISSIAIELGALPYSEHDGYKKFDSLSEIVN